MKFVEEFPHGVSETENLWISMSDGVRLAAKMWRPEVPEAVPAILEFIPYRKRDDHAFRDRQLHYFMAGHGYACIRVDMRGNGDSEGIMLDEYLPREQQDALEIIAWLAEQPWCNSRVGMMGLSWGAIASLQAATHRPEALKAVISVGGSVDRYYDDGCYLVGCYPGETIGWGSVMFAYCARPPDPEVVGDCWRDMWLERLERTPMFMETWLGHQLRDDYWLQGTVCTDYERLEVPVLAISGWNDCWPNTVLRLLENLNVPTKGVQGTWGHIYPCFGKPGPAADFLGMAINWWERWLKEDNVPSEDELALTAYIVDSHTPDPLPRDRPGRWIGLPAWPSPHVQPQDYFLAGDGKLTLEQDPCAGMVSVGSPMSTGLASGEYMPMFGAGDSAELPHDQRFDDAKSVRFDTAPLDTPLEILGTAKLHVNVASGHETGLIAARLCDVAPDGASTLICYGILNLQLRDGRDRVSAIASGTFYDVQVRLNDAGYRLLPGHRLRLALSNAYWPMAWPTPDRTTLIVNLSRTRLELPIYLGSSKYDLVEPFGPAQAAPPPPHEVLRQSCERRSITQDIMTGEVSYAIEADNGLTRRHDIDLTYGGTTAQVYRINDDDPLSASAHYRTSFEFGRGDWQVACHSELIVTCDFDNFIIDGVITANEAGKRVFDRKWQLNIPRTAY